MSSSQGQAQPGQAQHGAGGCAGPTACGLVWGRWCLARTGREARERRALHQAASAAATAKAAPGRRAPPRGRGAAITGLHDLRVADCLPLQRETVARQHQPLSPALGATIVVLVKVGAGLHDLNEVDVNMLRAIRGCLSGGRYRAGGRAWAEAAHRCHQNSQRAPCQKSSKLDPRPLGDNSLLRALHDLSAACTATNSFRHPQFYRHTPLAGSRRRLYGLQSSLHHQSIDSSSLVKQRRDCLRGRLASPRSRHNTFHIHSVSTPASSSWTSTSGQKRRMYVSSLPSRW